METITKNVIVGLPDEAFPVTVYNARPELELDEGTLDRAVEKGGVGVDRKSRWLKLKTLAEKVSIDLLFACAFGKARFR